MAENPFKPAAKEAVKARIALAGPAGSGKSYTALLFATQLADRVAAIDTEKGRLREHARRFKFDHVVPDRFDPRDLTKLLAQAGAAGYGAVVVDSWSHYWMGTGGALEFVDANTKPGGNKFSSGWNEYRPIENAMLDALLAYPGHVIVTMRVKTAYVVEQNAKGKSEPKKVGLKPEQREGVEYEFSIVGEIDRDHVLRVTKSTCEDLMDAEITKPGPETAAIIAEWCSDGTPSPDAIQYRDQALEPSMSAGDLRKLWVEVKERRMLGAAIIDEHGDDTTLGAMIARLGNERKPVQLATAAKDAA
ncbi:MAG TPA: AAA family ATPase [Rugosimonospora sp.]|nr:AAA family ATPase [Rugosimonospora sp.]